MVQKSTPLLRFLGTDKTLVESVVQVGEAYWDVSLNKFYVWKGTAWQEVTGGGVTDHGELDGLADDDHTQYLKTDGSRALTGNQDFAQHQAVALVIENRTSDPASPVNGQIWLRTDL